jgi:hypothetical protein
VQEVVAAVLSSSDAPVIQPAAKRLQQEHVILVLGECGQGSVLLSGFTTFFASLSKWV